MKITVYKFLVAYIVNITLLLTLFFSFNVTDMPVCPVQVTADGVGDAAPGCPGKGKVYGMFLRPLTTVTPQSPRWLIPILVSFGSDAARRLAEIFLAARLKDRIVALSTRTFGPIGRATAIALSFVGDFPACYGTMQMLTPARAFPSTPGRVPLWESPICWACGAGAHIIYNCAKGAAYRKDLRRQRAIIAKLVSLIGIAALRVFYDPVHALSLLLQALLCDIAVYYQKMFCDYLHPVAAFILYIFPWTFWDPFLARAHPGRRGSKPFYANDPAPVWEKLTNDQFWTDIDKLLSLHDLPWACPWIPGACSPRQMWRAFATFVRMVIFGDASGASEAGARAEDMWRFMLSMSHSAAALPCASSTRPSFIPSLVAYGPASHAAFCTLPRYIRWMDRVLPTWRESGNTFVRLGATISVEHGMKDIRRTYGSFGIATARKARRPTEVLMRLIEASMLVFMHLREPHRETASNTNRAYKDVPLSKVPKPLAAV